jgi:hypothetical protein
MAGPAAVGVADVDFTVTVESPDEELAVWSVEAVPYLVGDEVIVDGQLWEVTARTWTGPQDLTLTVIDPLAVPDTAGEDKP